MPISYMELNAREGDDVAVEERLVRCSCGREYNAARLEKCPACGRLPGQSAEVRGPVEPSGIPASRVTTLFDLPGYVVVRSIGVVTSLSANSGWTATSKGNNALDQALAGLRRTAAEIGANAILGLSGGPFGAHGGLTSGFGGDAVGILLLGSAVTVAHIPESYTLGAAANVRVPPGLRLEAIRLALEADPSLKDDDADSLERLAATVDATEAQLKLRFERDAVLAELGRRDGDRLNREAELRRAREVELARAAADTARRDAQARRSESGERVVILSASDKERLGAVPLVGTQPGWAADPLRTDRERFWNGTEWTGRIRDAQP